MIKITTYEPQLQQEIIKFRILAYQKFGRDSTQCEQWSSDSFDQYAIHILKFDEQQSIIGAVRIITDRKWTLEHYYHFPYNKESGVEFGRLATIRNTFQGKRVLFELIEAACEHCLNLGKTYFYGFVISPLKRQLLWDHAPLEILSPCLQPYGYPCYLVGFKIDAVLKYIGNLPSLHSDNSLANQ